MAEEFLRVAEVATGQHGAVTARQLGDAGVSSGRRRRQVQNGVLERSGSHTYRSPFVPRTARADLAAVVLDCGPDCVASGPTAAALHGFDGIGLHPPFHVTVLRGRNVQRAHHLVHTTTVLPRFDRAVVDSANAQGTPRTVPSRGCNSRGMSVFGPIGLHRWRHRRRGSRWSRYRERDSHRWRHRQRGHSWLERRFLDLCASAGLPRPQTQVVLSRVGGTAVRVDCRFPGTQIVVEVLGYRWHRTKDQMARDAERLNALLLDGLLPVQFTYDQVTIEPAEVLATLRHALAIAA